jgi:hypothetical protein
LEAESAAVSDTACETTGWRGRAARRLRRAADAIGNESVEVLDEAPGALERLPRALLERGAAEPGETDDDAAARHLRAVIEELYPTVADQVLEIAQAGDRAGVDVDAWVTIARMLYDAHMHRVGGPSIEARQRALLATLGQAIEAQARSSARLAGYGDDELDLPSTIDGDLSGTLVWEHYLCTAARLARSALHGEAVGNWLAALGELWAASDALYECATELTAHGNTRRRQSVAEREAMQAVLDRAKVALVRVQELSLW